MFKYLSVFISITLLSFMVSAKEAGQCHRQLKDLCKDKPSGKEKFECMKANASKLSPDCQKLMEEKMDHHAGPCKEDREKLCKDVAHGEGRMIRCMFEKKDQLSEGCKKKIEEKVAGKPCFADRIKFCKDVKHGEGRVHDCLKAKVAELSPACKEKVEKGKKEDVEDSKED